jgi:hypothetical protein
MATPWVFGFNRDKGRDKARSSAPAARRHQVVNDKSTDDQNVQRQDREKSHNREDSGHK